MFPLFFGLHLSRYIFSVPIFVVTPAVSLEKYVLKDLFCAAKQFFRDCLFAPAFELPQSGLCLHPYVSALQDEGVMHDEGHDGTYIDSQYEEHTAKKRRRLAGPRVPVRRKSQVLNAHRKMLMLQLIRQYWQQGWFEAGDCFEAQDLNGMGALGQVTWQEVPSAHQTNRIA